MEATKIVGNNYKADESLGFKEDVSQAFESYRGAGANLAADFMQIISSPEKKNEFIDTVMESVMSSSALTKGDVVNIPFYDNYNERLRQLMDNSLRQIATESAMLGYAPIVAYNPFFLKKQWVATVFKDILMSEVPTNALINIGFEKRFVKGMDGTEYSVPDVYYDDAIMAKLLDESTGLKIKEDPIEMTSFDPYLSILDDTYIPGIIPNDPNYELTQDLTVQTVYMTDAAGTEVAIPCNVRIDITTHNFINGKIRYKVSETEMLEDELFGNVDFVNGNVVLRARDNKIKKVSIKGTISNRWNNRSLDVERRVERLEFVMPESGPRLNSAVTVEDASDAMVLQKIDIIADKADMMGATLGELQDFSIRTYLDNSFAQQIKVKQGPYGFGSMVAEATFDALPYEEYRNNITEWMKDSREYFERLIDALKNIIKTPNVVINVVGHPTLVRFLQNGINWVFSDSTSISGMKISYDFGILTTSQDKVHVITSHYMRPEKGLRFVVISTSPEVITFKHFWQNVVIDRGYRNPMHTLVPNVMVTQRTLTFDVWPIQGNMYITGRDLMSPTTLKRSTTNTSPETGNQDGQDGEEVGG